MQQVVLIGKIGSGKTSFHNRITQSDEKVVAGGESVTLNVFLKKAAFGSIPFKALDTPGFGSSTQKLDHAAGIIAALTEGQVTRILVVIKLDRIDTMKKDLAVVIGPILRYKNIITAVVTHWDNIKTKEEQLMNEAKIKEQFLKYSISSIIFTSDKEDPSLTCSKIIEEMKRSDPLQIQLVETEFSQFDLAEFEENLEAQIECSKGELLRIFRIKANLITKQIQKYSNIDNNLIDILHALTIESKKIAEQTLSQFEKENWDLFQRLEEEHGKHYQFLLHTVLKKEMERDLEQISKMCQEKMKQNTSHCFNYIRRCPYPDCGQIWMKVEGCGGKTVCGAVPRKDQLLTASTPQKWIVNWKKNEIEVIFNSEFVPKKTDVKTFQKDPKRKILTISNNQAVVGPGSEQYEIGEKGCQRVINWADMLPISAAELSELTDAGMLDYLCKKDSEIEKQTIEALKPFEFQLKNAIERKRQLIASG